MLKGLSRQREGSIVCPSCKQLVSVNLKSCPHCHRWRPGFFGYGKALKALGKDWGFRLLVIWGCLLLYGISLIIDFRHIRNDLPDILSPSTLSLMMMGATGSIPVFGLHRWWTVLSAGWLHGSLLHIGFNLAWINMLSPLVGEVFGTGRLAIIYTVSCLMGGLLSSGVGYYNNYLPDFLQGANISIGASGAIFGLMGALVAFGQITGNPKVKEQFWTWAVVCFAFGFLMSNVDNWAHLGGFLGGYSICFIPWMDVRYAEKGSHFWVGLSCIGLMLLSVMISPVQLLWLWFQYH